MNESFFLESSYVNKNYQISAEINVNIPASVTPQSGA